MSTPGRRTDLALLAERTIVGGYLAAHGAQKLFGWFDGPGLEPVAGHFESIGLRPGWVTSRTAGLAEFVGGTLTMLGMADPMGPVALAGTMAVASSTHLDNGAFTANRGYELPLTNFAAALALATTGPGRYSVDRLVGRRLPRSLTGLGVVGAAGAAAVTLNMVLRTRKAKQSATVVVPVEDETDADVDDDHDE